MTDNSQSLVNKSESEKLVLASLRRNDESIEEVLVTANHVCLYEFQLNVSQWKRRTVEGSLFIVKRSSHPRFQLIILNRLSPANHVEDMGKSKVVPVCLNSLEVCVADAVFTMP